MSTYYHTATIECLKLFSISDMSTIQLASRLDTEREIAKNRIDNLHSQQLIASRRDNTTLVYFITPKGERLLRRFSKEREGDMPEPRRPVTTGTYDGAELRPFKGRVGAMDAFNLPSLGFGSPQ